MAKQRLSGAERAAMLISALDEDRASRVLEAMSDDAIRRLRRAAESLRPGSIGREEKLVTLASFIKQHRGSPLMLGDPQARFRQILEDAIEKKEADVEQDDGAESPGAENFETSEGQEEEEEGGAAEMIHRMVEMIREAPAQDVAALLEQESIRCAAVLLSEMPGDLAGELLNLVEVERREKMIDRVFTMGQISEPILREIIGSFTEKLHESQFGSGGGSEDEKLDQLADMVAGLEGDFQKRMLSRVEEQDEDMAEEIERRIFAFEDLVNVEERSLQQLLGKIDSSTIALAIKGVDEELEDLVMENLSQRVVEQVNEERELAGSVPLSEAREARDEIMRVAREMEREEELTFTSGDEEEELVE